MNLNRLAYFAAVVDTGSFTRAAERLGITKAVVSQQVAQLERDLGTSLLVRTTRRVHPTEAGRTFHARCVMILREAEDAFDELAQAAAQPTGTLRITAPNDYGTAVVVAVVTAYAARYPNCRVELTLRDETVDLASGQIDMAIRVGWLVDSSLQARKIGSFRQILVGAPAFTDRIAAARDPDDLVTLPFIANMALREPLLWQFSRGDLDRRAVRLQASIAIDTTPGVLAAVLAGGGLSVLPDFLVADDLAAGRLIHILPQWQLPSGGIHTVYPAARFRPPKVTAFVEMLIAAQRRASSVGAD
ncbi:LysR family transcriptional regulator [Bradyrhizobium canariense]|uniref:LysR family transcriptional regulator n=1 Tax=Bradyrhizobium canariense TaxID=255045 RepID=UPI001B89EE49|nr:LysR family transcriptional regulator [Bradyrhizobium canariense]MBR0951264.1 LysR family transcriptional regulator [Bradyrhizobium canariense]